MSKKQGERGFFNRWSSLKSRSEQPPEAPEAPEAQQGQVDTGEPGLTSADAGTSAPLPDVEGGDFADSNSASLSNNTIGVPYNPVPDEESGQKLCIQDSNPNCEVVDAIGSEEPELLSDADMPPIDTLDAESDLSGFFNKGVSASLKKAALRHVFQQSKYNIRDGLNDYDGDYTVFEPLGDTVTSDMKWHIARKERERLEAEALEQERLREMQLQQAEDCESSTDDDMQEQSADTREPEKVVDTNVESEPVMSDSDLNEDETQPLPDVAIVIEQASDNDQACSSKNESASKREKMLHNSVQSNNPDEDGVGKLQRLSEKKS